MNQSLSSISFDYKIINDVPIENNETSFRILVFDTRNELI